MSELSQLSLNDYLLKNKKLNEDKIFIFDEKKKISYKDALKYVTSTSLFLEEKGIKKGYFIAIKACRNIDFILILLSLHLLGAITILCDDHLSLFSYLNDNFPLMEPRYFIDYKDGKYVLYDENKKEISAINIVSKKRDINYYLNKCSDIDVFATSDIIFTSGSSGKAKAVCLKQYGYINNSVEAIPFQDHQEGDIAIDVLPQYHIFGMSVIINALVSNHSIFIPKEITEDYVLSCIEKYKISRIYSVPTYFLKLSERQKTLKKDLSSLNFGLMAGAPSTDKQLIEIENTLGIKIATVYGMSEYIGIARTTFTMPYEKRVKSVGKFYPSNLGKIINNENKECKKNEIGEILIKGYGMMNGYYLADDLNMEAIDKDGFLHTGDLGYLDKDGFLYICGRKKDIIIRGGENISALQIERVVLDYDGIKNCCVCPIKDELYGEEVGLMIDVKKRTFNQKKFNSYLKGKLTKIQLPKKIIYSEIPLTHSGKVDKQKIKEILNNA